jgi:hypothetical protein
MALTQQIKKQLTIRSIGKHTLVRHATVHDVVVSIRKFYPQGSGHGGRLTQNNNMSQEQT